MNSVDYSHNFKGSRRKALVRVLLGVVAITFLSELLVMTILFYFPIESRVLEMIVDSVGLSLLSAPLIWFFVIRKFERERDLAASQLQQNHETMVHVSRMTTLGEVAKGLAHEINNPLQIITGAGQVIARSSDEKMALWGQRITESGRRISKILKGILIFTGIEGADKGKKNSIHTIFSDFQDFIGPKLEEKNVLLKMSVDCPDEILFDEAILFHLLTNFTQNALDAIDGYQKPLFEIDTFITGDKLNISFSDNGKGIGPEVEARIFEPFFTTKEVGKGTGLGLTLSKGIVTRLNGKITLTSRKNPTVFLITLPL